MAEALQLDPGLTSPARARAWMRDICDRHDLNDLRDDAVVMVSELVTNAVLHAGTGCEVYVELADHAMRVDVVDEDHHVGGPLTVPDGPEQRRGLAIVAALASGRGVIYRDAGKSVWFTLISDHAVDAPEMVAEERLKDPR